MVFLGFFLKWVFVDVFVHAAWFPGRAPRVAWWLNTVGCVSCSRPWKVTVWMMKLRRVRKLDSGWLVSFLVFECTYVHVAGNYVGIEWYSSSSKLIQFNSENFGSIRKLTEPGGREWDARNLDQVFPFSPNIQLVPKISSRPRDFKRIV